MSQLFRTPFGRTSTASEVIDGVDLSGKTAVITGAGSGGNTSVSVRALDLSDQDSVQAFATDWGRPLHILVNNAGIMALPELEHTGEGWEMRFATNFMGHFALTIGLHDALAAAHGARIVSVRSSGNLFSPVVFDDLHFDFRPYDPLVAYGQSKTADALLAVEATRRWSGDGIYANALNPGAIATGPQRYTGGLKTPTELRKPVAEGAATSVLLAASPLLDKIGGRYLEDCNEALTVTRRPADYTGVAWYALDPRERTAAVGHRARHAASVSLEVEARARFVQKKN